MCKASAEQGRGFVLTDAATPADTVQQPAASSRIIAVRAEAEYLGTRDMVLYGYFRSSAAWRVRIALNLKSVAVAHASRNLQNGEQHPTDYLHLNPQALVPTLLLVDTSALTQSLAICEWLDETFPDPPLLPGGANERARIRAFALVIAADIHPVQGGRTQSRLRKLGIPEGDITSWAQEVVTDGLRSCEGLVGGHDHTFCFGRARTLADICLNPQ